MRRQSAITVSGLTLSTQHWETEAGEVDQEFEVTLGCITSLRPAWDADS